MLSAPRAFSETLDLAKGNSMSFSQTVGPAAKLGGTLLRATSLGAMARAVGIIVGAGLLAAIYHTANEETRAVLHSIRLRRRYSQARHEAILIAMLGSSLDLTLRDNLLRSRNAFNEALALLVNPELSDEDRELVRSALYRSCNIQIS
jgi:hypothetical protein